MGTKINVAEYKRHLDLVGASDISSYLSWCEKHGFSTAINKSKAQLNKEIEFINRDVAVREILRDNSKLTTKKAIELIRSGTSEFRHSKFNCVAKIYHEKEHPEFLYIDKEAFLDILAFFDKKTKILERGIFIFPLARLIVKKDSWIRPWETWKPNTYNAERQFLSFVHHVLAKYEVPDFFDQVWTRDNGVEHDWYIHVAQGKNIMTAPGFLERYPCTKKMAHFFMQAPSNYDFKKAWRFGQVMAMGGTPRLTEAVIGSKLYSGTTLDDFCLSIIRFFIANPMLDLAQVGPIVDYIWNQKYENQTIFVGRGQIEHRGPPQPNFSMTGRTVESLMAQVERWHRQLGKEKKGGDQHWEHSSSKDFEFQEGSNESRNVKFWRITELLSSRELSSEGRAMHHCVASYAGSCASGRSSIWSLTRQDHTGLFKHLTIEISGKRLNQIRGLNNRGPTEKEMSIIKRWVSREGFGVDSWSSRIY
jgi:hypothetical protein